MFTAGRRTSGGIIPVAVSHHGLGLDLAYLDDEEDISAEDLGAHPPETRRQAWSDSGRRPYSWSAITAASQVETITGILCDTA